MNTNEKMRNLDEDYIIAFRNILKEAERMEREAMDRFHSWSNGMMDPAMQLRSALAGCERKAHSKLHVISTDMFYGIVWAG